MMEKNTFKLGIYDAAFSQKGYLKMHIESVHEAKKQFLCNDCVSSFSWKGHMNGLTESVHEGKKPFLCNDCGKTFLKHKI